MERNSLHLAHACASLALDIKAEDVVIIHVEGVTSYTDYVVVASANSERQVSAIASKIEDEMRICGIRPLGVEGKGTDAWVLLDYGDVVVHLYLDDARAYYDLDGLWSEAPHIDPDEDLATKVRKDWAAIHSESIKERRESL